MQEITFTYAYHYLRNKAVEVGVGGTLNVERASADVINGFIVQEDSNIGVLQERMGGEDTVVWLNNRGGHLRRGVDCETKLGFLAIIYGKPFQEKGSKTRTSATTNGIKNQKTLETSAVVRKLSDTIQAKINYLLPN